MVDRFKFKARRAEAPQLQFVKAVRVTSAPAPWRIHWKTAILGGFWILIAVKCLLAHWAIQYWDMPFGSGWVLGPTLFAAIVCTVVFLASGED